MITTWAVVHCLSSLWSAEPVCKQSEVVFRNQDECHAYVEEQERIEPDHLIYCAPYEREED